MTQPAIAGLILSAGASSRMGTPKALLGFQGETFLDRLLRLFAAVCSSLTVVLGYEPRRILEGVRRVDAANVIINPDPARGMLSSLQCGLAGLREMDAVMFTPVDYPAIAASTVQELAAAWERTRAPLAVPVYRGERGHPVCIGSSVVAQLLELPPSAQARDVIRAHYAGACFVEVDDPGIVADVDRPEDYRALLTAAEAL
ncbi:MAG: nucleotidyltransferase family protein [Acidobacteriaceae bacterium]|nr:nucleotidyltransferase family protein [Acidobacteriaceae bacterium]